MISQGSDIRVRNAECGIGNVKSIATAGLICQAEKTGAAGEVVSYIPIEQSWSPRVFDSKQLVR